MIEIIVTNTVAGFGLSLIVYFLGQGCRMLTEIVEDMAFGK